MPAYWIRYLDRPVAGAWPSLITRFESRARRRCRRLQQELNAAFIDTYRYEVLWDVDRKRWVVMPMQNVRIPAPRMPNG